MSWALKGLAGPLKGQTFHLKTGITLGRQGDVAIADIKASALHARIHRASDGQWLLQDNSSKNGTRIEGERITQVPLNAGLIFYIGDQGFEVLEIAEKVKPNTVTSALPPQAEVATAPVAVTPPASSTPTPIRAAAPLVQPREIKRYWYDILSSFAQQNVDTCKDRVRPVTPLEPALVLDFVRGIQTNSHWILGYGPRKVGPASLDLPLWEPGAPAICFEIAMGPDGIVFITDYPQMVQLNGEGVDSRVLRVGDTIRILETVIEVDFAE